MESPASAASPSAAPQNRYREALDFLFGRNQFAMKLGLRNMQGLLSDLGHPEKGLDFVHVAGTNGKGSVCMNLAHLLRAFGPAGPVGLYTSPHLVSFRERIQVDGEPLPKEDLVLGLDRLRPFALAREATYFECATALALDHFARRRCGPVVLETGLGGRLDATNTVTPRLCIITSISLDHTGILGDTVEAIFGEKLGILKPGVPVVVDEDRPSLLALLRERAEALSCPVWNLRDFDLREAGSELVFRGRFGVYRFPGSLRPEGHQRRNLALSLLALETLSGRPLPPAEALLPVLEKSRFPGRTEWLKAPGRRPVLLDGAHNPGGMAALAAYLEREKALGHHEGPVDVAFCMMRDKDFGEALSFFRRFADRLFFVPLPAFPRALTWAEVEEILEAGMPGTGRVRPLAGAADLLPLTAGPGTLVLCGSLYFLGEAIRVLCPLFPGLSFFRQFEEEILL